MKGTKPQQRAMSILCLSFPRENSQLKKSDTNVTMLTEEQIQILAKKLSKEHEVDEEQCEKHVRFIDTVSEVFHALLPEEQQEVLKKTLEGEFFERLLQKSFSLGKQIINLYRMCQIRVSSTQLRLSLKKNADKF